MQNLNEKLLNRLKSFNNIKPNHCQIEATKIISKELSTINVSKSGVSAEIYNIAQNYSTLYGIFAVILAVLVGWGTNLIFRKV